MGLGNRSERQIMKGGKEFSLWHSDVQWGPGVVTDWIREPEGWVVVLCSWNDFLRASHLTKY